MSLFKRGLTAALLPSAMALVLLTSQSAAHLSIIRQEFETAGANEAWNRTGQSLAAGDFNGDGFEDLAMGAPGEDVGSLLWAGAVAVNWGSAFGVTHEGSFILTADDMLGGAEEGAQVGYALAAGDFNDDGFDDLAVGAPYTTVSGIGSAGRIHILKGTPSGLTPWYAFEQNDFGEIVESLDIFGSSLAVGNFNGDAYEDLAVGSPGENTGRGAVLTLHGSGAGPVVVGAWFTQGLLGFGEQPNDFFGYSLATGNLIGSAHDDLAVGTPYSDESGVENAGRVYVVTGSPSGLTGAGVTVYNCNAVNGIFESDYFSAALAVGDFYGEAYDGLAVGVPGRDVSGIEDAGQVIVAKGGPNLLEWIIGDPIVLTSDMAGGVPEIDDAFGFALAAGHFGDPADGFEDLIVGAPGDGFGFTTQAGAVSAVFGGPSGPDGANWMIFNQGAMGEAIEGGEQLGFGLVIGRFESGTFGSVAAGAPGEDESSGMVHVIAPWRQTYGLSCVRSIVYDCEGNRIFSQKPFDRIKIASTTKIMTVLLAAERTQLPPNDPLFVDINATYDVPGWVDASIPGSQVPLLSGERLTLGDLMFTCIMVSGNDAAFAIADMLAGGGGPNTSVPIFVGEMNDRAAQLGMTGTHFHNPAGLDSEPVGPDLGEHFSTADDMAKLSRAALANPLFAQVVNTPVYNWTRQWLIGSQFFNVPWLTQNGFLMGLQNSLGNMTGIKGGWTPGARITGCFSALDPITGGTAVAGHYSTSCDPAACGSYVPDAVNLVGLGLAACGVEFTPVEEDDYIVDAWFNEMSSADGAISGGASRFMIVDDDMIQFDLFRLDNDGEVSVITEDISRISEILIAAGDAAPYGIRPFEGMDSLKIVNMGEDNALFRLTHPTIGAQTYNLAPAEWLIVPPYEESMGQMSWFIDNVSGVEIYLGVEETYWKRVVTSGDGGAEVPVYSALLTRDGRSREESFGVVGRGHDQGDGKTYYAVVHSPGVVVDAPEIDPEPAGSSLLRVLSAGPNPFSHTTQIAFDLYSPADVGVSIYDVSGRRVRSFEPRRLGAARWRITWDGTSDGGDPVAKGSYFYRVDVDGKEEGGGKLIVVR